MWYEDRRTEREKGVKGGSIEQTTKSSTSNVPAVVKEVVVHGVQLSGSAFAWRAQGPGFHPQQGVFEGGGATETLFATMITTMTHLGINFKEICKQAYEKN